MKEVQQQRHRLSLLILCTAMLLWPVAALAAGDVQDVDQLKTELQTQRQRQAELEDKINQLEARQKLKERALNEKIEQATAPQEKSQEAKEESKKKENPIPEILQWASRVGLYGDFRYRYEFIDDKSKDFDRNRNRIRARLGLNAKVNDEWNLGFRLATGEGDQEGDPVSTNQTLGGSWGKKPFWLDLAYLDYHPLWAKGLDLQAGKIEVPFYRPNKNQLIWDHDLTPEGGAINKAKDPGSWQFDYDYRDIQADAVVGQFNDSDFVGGGTGGRGHRFGVGYVLTKNVVPALNYYLASYEGRNNNTDYRRLQADVVVKF